MTVLLRWVLFVSFSLLSFLFPFLGEKDDTAAVVVVVTMALVVAAVVVVPFSDRRVPNCSLCLFLLVGVACLLLASWWICCDVVFFLHPNEKIFSFNGIVILRMPYSMIRIFFDASAGVTSGTVP